VVGDDDRAAVLVNSNRLCRACPLAVVVTLRVTDHHAQRDVCTNPLFCLAYHVFALTDLASPAESTLRRWRLEVRSGEP